MERRRALKTVLVFLLTAVALDGGISVFAIENGKLLGRPLLPSRVDQASLQAWVEAQRASASARPTEAPVSGFDPELGWTHYPSTGSRDGRVHYNRLGARGRREYAPSPPEGVLRVALFGESFVQGAQISDEETFEHQLEQRCATLEVLNFGVNSYGVDQALLRFRRDGRKLGAHVLALGLIAENIGRNVNRYRPLWGRARDTPAVKPRFILEQGELVLVAPPFRTQAELVDAVERGAIPMLFGEHEYWWPPAFPTWAGHSSCVRVVATLSDELRRRISHQWTDREGEPYRVMRALLSAFCREAKAAGAQHALILVLPQETAVQVLTRGDAAYWNGMLDELRSAGVDVIDTCPAMAALYPASKTGGADPVLFDHMHLNRAGNAVVAQLIEDWLRARYPTLRP